MVSLILMKLFKTVHKKKFKSFSLIEVLVFITVFSIFFIAGLSISLYSLNTLKLAEHKLLANYYAQEGIEWIKKEKELNWNNFINKATTNGKKYCLNQLNWIAGECSGFHLNNFYKRDVLLTLINDSVNVNLTIYWLEKNNINNINIKTILNLWE